jgi:hypothetical protein
MPRFINFNSFYAPVFKDLNILGCVSQNRAVNHGKKEYTVYMLQSSVLCIII